MDFRVFHVVAIEVEKRRSGKNGGKWSKMAGNGRKMAENWFPRLFGRKWISACFTPFPYYFHFISLYQISIALSHLFYLQVQVAFDYFLDHFPFYFSTILIIHNYSWHILFFLLHFYFVISLSIQFLHFYLSINSADFHTFPFCLFTKQWSSTFKQH